VTTIRGVSEYQYYEFLALDRPLTSKQRAELRSISSRAEITATRFVNEYEWGDLKGDPLEMVKEYFDAFLYWANWGTRQLMFRLPRGVLDPETARQYCPSDTVSLIETDSHLIVNWLVDRDPDEWWEEPAGQLAAIAQVRSELAAGDLRLLYLSWLLFLQSYEVADDDIEPPVPAGLGNLGAGLQAVVDFFEIDEDLIAVAAAASAAIQEPGGRAEWIGSLPVEEKDALLARVADGEGAQVQALLLRRFRAASDTPAAPGRTAAELWEAAADRKEARAKAAERRRRKEEARKAAAQAAAYAERLDKLAARKDEAWAKVADLIETRKPREYDLAVLILRDLQALADRQEDPAAFRKRFLELRARHDRKPSLQERFDQAGLPS
jgi:hypothetical protein